MGDSSRAAEFVTDTNISIKLESYRWIIVTIYAVYSGINTFLFMQFTIIADTTERFYNVGKAMTDATAVVFLGAYLILFVPVGHFIERHNMRTTSLIGTGITAVANLLKLFAASQDRFILILLSQSLCGIAQVFMVSTVTKVSNTWFGPEEVSTACGIGVLGGQIGSALGSLIATILVPDTQNIRSISKGFQALFIFDNVISISIFIVVLLFFRSKPELPPSQSQAMLLSEQSCNSSNYSNAFRKLLKNRDFLLVLISFGISFGIWTSMAIFVNEMYLHYLPGDRSSLGVLVLIAVISGGVFGSMIFGYILDKTHAYKLVTILVMSLNVVSWICTIIALQEGSVLGAHIFFSLTGFFNGSVMVLGFEYAIETTYPTPEAFGATLLNASIYTCAIINVILVETAFQTFGFLSGQIMIGVFYVIAAITVLFITSDLKRRSANLLGTHSKGYDSISEGEESFNK